MLKQILHQATTSRRWLMLFPRMFKRCFQQGRNERGAEAYCFLYVAGTKRRENAAGVPFQHPIQWRKWRMPVRIIAIPCSSAALTTS